jgi:hypothetical protein
VSSLRWDQQPAERRADHISEHIFADEWRMLAQQRPVQEQRDLQRGDLQRGDLQRGDLQRDLEQRNSEQRSNLPVRVDRHLPARVAEAGGDYDDDDGEYWPEARHEEAHRKPFAAPLGAGFKRVAIGLGAVLLLAGGGIVLFEPGVLKHVKPVPAAGSRVAIAASSPGELPGDVARLPAVVTLQRKDPAAFERFKRRYLDSAANARDDEVLSLARFALRKSVKHLLAIAPGDVLLEITETSLAYMQGLQATNPESCVALSDESKGARLTSNLARDLPNVFVRDMAVLDRIASTNPHMAITPMTVDEVQPYLGTVFGALRRQQVKSDLLGRDRLDPSEFAPYCALVIAFYKAVLDLPRDDKVNLLRFLYASAAVNADNDLKR